MAPQTKAVELKTAQAPTRPKIEDGIPLPPKGDDEFFPLDELTPGQSFLCNTGTKKTKVQTVLRAAKKKWMDREYTYRTERDGDNERYRVWRLR